MLKILFLVGVFYSINLSAQVGIGTATPTPGTILDVSSTNKALIIPRLTTTQRDGIISPAAGMLIYNTTLSKFQGFVGSGSPSSLTGSTVGLTNTYVSQNDYPAQSFQLSSNASNVNLSFWVDQFYNSFTSGNVTFELYAGLPNSSGSLLYSTSFLIDALGQKTIAIRNINLTANTNYYFLLKPTSSFAAGWLAVARSNGATPGTCTTGTIWYFMSMGMGSSWMDSQVDDLKFDISTLGGTWENLH